MKLVKPEVFLVGETRTVDEGLEAYLSAIGVPGWRTDAGTDIEKLVEVMGRLCYRSFAPGLNANVTKVRQGSKTYLGNIIKTRHGSVAEHTVVNVIFHNVSRVFTHEIVRHRPAAISQESLRYVRLDQDLRMWMPDWALQDTELVARCLAHVEQAEELQTWMAQHFEIDKDGVEFKERKHKTSFMRRWAPDGLATTIGWSANIRELRWLLELRTDPSAEEEIRLVVGMLGTVLCQRYPNLFQDYTVSEEDGAPVYKTENRKI